MPTVCIAKSLTRGGAARSAAAVHNFILVSCTADEHEHDDAGRPDDVRARVRCEDEDSANAGDGSRRGEAGGVTTTARGGAAGQQRGRRDASDRDKVDRNEP